MPAIGQRNVKAYIHLLIPGNDDLDESLYSMSKILIQSTVSDKYFDVSFLYTQVKISPVYDGGLRGRIRHYIEFARSGRSLRNGKAIDVIPTIKKLGVDPTEYAANETETLARAMSWFEDGRFISNHQFYEELLTSMRLSRDSYLPRWEHPILIWYTITRSDGPEFLKIVEHKVILK